MTRTTLSRGLRATTRVGMISAATAIVAGCGGGSSDSASRSTPDTTPSPAIASPEGPLTLVVDSAATFALPAPSATEYQKQLSIATANAGVRPVAAPPAPGSAAFYDPAELRRQWCYTAENTGRPPELSDLTVLPPTQAFDNVWAFGPRWVLQYAFVTPGGKVLLLDTLNNTAEAQTIIDPGLVAMGFTGQQIVAAMPTHGHGDHFGGSGYLQQTYGTPIFLGSADAGVGATATPPFTVTPIDSTNLQPQSLDFDGLQTTLLSTPGHTPGTVSGVLPVRLAGQTYKLAFWGGTGMPNTLAQAQQYLDGTERLYRLAQAENVDGTLHTHPFVDGSLAKLDALRADPSLRNNANPFLIGNALALRSYAVLRSCAAAKVAQLDATASLAAWHTTTLAAEVAAGSTGDLTVTATLRSAYGALRDGTVTFDVQPAGTRCVAATNAQGQASCRFPAAGTVTAVTAAFEEATLADGSVELASKTTWQATSP